MGRSRWKEGHHRERSNLCTTMRFHGFNPLRDCSFLPGFLRYLAAPFKDEPCRTVSVCPGTLDAPSHVTWSWRIPCEPCIQQREDLSTCVDPRVSLFRSMYDESNPKYLPLILWRQDHVSGPQSHVSQGIRMSQSALGRERHLRSNRFALGCEKHP